MKRLYFLAVMVVVSLSFAVLAEGLFCDNIESFIAEGNGSIRVFVRLRDVPSRRSADPVRNLMAAADASFNAFRPTLNSVTRSRNLNMRRFWAFNGFAATLNARELQALRNNPHIQAAFIPPSVNQDFPDGDGSGPDNYVYAIPHMNVDKVWRDFGLTGNGVRVGVVDSGLDTSYDFIRDILARGRNFTGDPMDISDPSGHGTHISGSLAGGVIEGDVYVNVWGNWVHRGDFSGRIGVAPGITVDFARVVGDDGSIDFENIVSALEWIATLEDRSQVVNVSLTSYMHQPEMREPISNIASTGLMMVFAVGNNAPYLGSPADIPEVFSVGAVDNNNTLAGFSCYGPVTWDGVQYTKPEIVAPGVGIISVMPGKIARADGTSSSAPYVAGIIALLLEADSTLTSEQLRALLKDTALGLGFSKPNRYFGWGLVDAYKAVSEVTGRNAFKADFYRMHRLRETAINLSTESSSSGIIRSVSRKIRQLEENLSWQVFDDPDLIRQIMELEEEGYNLDFIYQAASESGLNR